MLNKNLVFIRNILGFRLKLDVLKNEGITIGNGSIAYYNHDFYAAYSVESKILMLNNYNNKASTNLLLMINSILNSNELIIQNGLEFKNLKTKVFDASTLELFCVEIDYELTKYIKRYFPNLKLLVIHNSHILKSASFKDIDASIHILDDSIIDDMLVFNGTKSNLNILYSNIISVTHSEIYSTSIKFNSIEKKYIPNLADIFLKCNFPNLKELYLDKKDGLSNNVGSFENDLLFMPYSCPKLESLYIGGKVANLRFLEKLPYIHKCGIQSECDSDSFFYPYITDSHERKRIESTSKKEIEYFERIHPEVPRKYLSSSFEYERILSLVDTYYLVSLRYPNELEDLKKGINESIQFTKGKVDEYYLLRYNKLRHILREDQDYLEPTYSIENNIMYQDNRPGKILKTRSFIYHPSGIPILFDELSRYKPIEVYRDEKDEDNFELMRKKRIQDAIEELLEENEYVSLSDLYTSIVYYRDFSLEASDFKNHKVLKALIEKLKTNIIEIDNLKQKKTYYSLELMDLISKYYDDFSLEEKIYIYKHFDDYMDHSVYVDKQASFIEIDDVSCLVNINLKTNNRYSYLMNKLKIIEKLISYKYKNEIYDKDITSELENIKRLGF